MASQADLDTAIANLQTGTAALLTSVATLLTETTNAFNRLLAKIAAGIDTQPSIDKITPLIQSLADTKASVDSAIAQAQVEGN